jgi:hypothetical protein
VSFDQSFNRSTLARCFTNKDFYKDEELSDEVYRKKIIKEAMVKTFDPEVYVPEVMCYSFLSKKVYSLPRIEDKIIYRKCALNIKKAINYRPKPRKKIIRELKGFLRDGTGYRVYKFDIESFFESCDQVGIQVLIDALPVSIKTKKLIFRLIDVFNNGDRQGIPRGVEISSVLADIVMLEFDDKFSKDDRVLYYSRFVDDILIVTAGTEESRAFSREVGRHLPEGLSFNYNKKKIINVSPRGCGGDGGAADLEVASFEYLGFLISIVDTGLLAFSAKPKSQRNKIDRRVDVDISPRKIKKIKSRVIRSFIDFSSGGDYSLLYDRILFLSSNRLLLDKKSLRRIPTGIYYNFSEITNPEKSLGKIDDLLKVIVLNPKGRIKDKIGSLLTDSQKKKILSMSFLSGHNDIRFRRFSPNRMSEIARIW